MSNTPITIMIIEDEEILMDAILRKIHTTNLTAIAVSNGRDALSQLQTMQPLPDAIWLDYYLRDMNGLEFVEEIKKLENLSHIPILVVSNSANSEIVQKMLALGVSKYILKAEHKLEEIIDMMRELATASQKNSSYSNS